MRQNDEPVQRLFDPKTDHLKGLVKSLKVVAFDFDGVFTANTVYVFEDGREAVRCSRGDGFGLRMLENISIEPMIISTETNPVVSQRSKKLNIFCRQGCQNKISDLTELLEERGVKMSECAFVGNDVNDLECLRSVGFPIVVHDAHPDVVSAARYRTNSFGGCGAVREVCDLVAHLRGISD